MNNDRIREIHEGTACATSQSVRLALLQVWNECQQESDKEIKALKVDNIRRIDECVGLQGVNETLARRLFDSETEVTRLRVAINMETFNHDEECECYLCETLNKEGE